MAVAEKCVNFIAGWEGFRPNWYQDVAGVWTIGYGFTERGGRVERGVTETPMSKRRGKQLLRAVLSEDVKPRIQAAVEVKLRNQERWALMSFCFNLGLGAFRNSTLLEVLNEGREEAAAEEFEKWVYAGGEVIEGLKRRRQAERELFERADTPRDPLVEVGPIATPVRVAEPERLGDPTIDVPEELPVNDP